MIDVRVVEIGDYICETPLFRYKSQDLLVAAFPLGGLLSFDLVPPHVF
jgi:hypothetical protein